MRSWLAGAMLAMSGLLALPAAASPCAVPTDAQDPLFGAVATVPGDPGRLALKGYIVPETAADFLCALESRPEARLLILDSDGGAVEAALDIGYQLRRRGMATYIPPGAACFSACAFIFLAGTRRAAEGTLGLHQLVNDPDGIAFARVVEALEAFGTNRGVLSAMLMASPHELFVFSAHALKHLGINSGDPLAAANAKPAPGFGLPYRASLGWEQPPATGP